MGREGSRGAAVVELLMEDGGRRFGRALAWQTGGELQAMARLQLWQTDGQRGPPWFGFLGSPLGKELLLKKYP